MTATDFPDNFVVCHAHRQVRTALDVFVGGSVLAVNRAQPFTFFPDVYNEDWLFFYDNACSAQLGWSGRNTTQLYYDPFEQPQRGWWGRCKDDVTSDYLNYVGFEAGAAFIRQFQLGDVPGLLQTADYAEVVRGVRSVAPVADLCLRRQTELGRRSRRPRQYFMLDEAVIRQHVGIEKDRTIMQASRPTNASR